MSDNPYNEHHLYDHEGNYTPQTTPVDVDKVISTLGSLTGKGIVSFATARLIIKPFLEDLTGRKIRTVPLWLTFDILWNFLVNTPYLTAKKLTREERDQELMEQELREMGVAPREGR
jgi:hypothetical protein